MFISYDIRNGVEYAKLCISKRNGKTVSKSYIYLGKVIDKEKFIFFNKDRGLFNYNPVDNSYTSLNSQSNIYAQDTLNNDKKVDDSSKVNDIEFQRAKFNNELPKLDNSNIDNRSIFEDKSSNSTSIDDSLEEKDIDEKEDINDDIDDNYDSRFEFLNNQHIHEQNTRPYYQKSPINVQQTYTKPVQKDNFVDEDFRSELEPKKEEKHTEYRNFDIDYILKNTIPYGDVDFIQKIIAENQINDVIDLTNVANRDLLYVLIFHNILGENSTDIKYWYDHSFIKYLYPNVDCSEKSIFEDLENQEEQFFNLYQQNVVRKLDTSIINITNIIGNTRLLINHQGIPICCLDAKTNLQDVIDTLKKNEINSSKFIVNMDDLCECSDEVKLIANVSPKHELYDIILDYYSANNLDFVKYDEVFYQICKKQIQYEQYNLFTYTFCDILKQSQRTIQALANFSGNVQNFKMTFDSVVVSNGDFDTRKMLEIIKMTNPFNNFVFQSQNAVINFISSIIISATSKRLKVNFFDAMLMLKNVKCFVDEKNNKHVIENFDFSKILSY